MALITAAHLTPAVTPVYIAGIEPLYVTAQSHAPGTQEKRGTTVMISVEQPTRRRPRPLRPQSRGYPAFLRGRANREIGL